jgi:hypothetical protein
LHVSYSYGLRLRMKEAGLMKAPARRGDPEAACTDTLFK